MTYPNNSFSEKAFESPVGLIQYWIKLHNELHKDICPEKEFPFEYFRYKLINAYPKDEKFIRNLVYLNR